MYNFITLLLLLFGAGLIYSEIDRFFSQTALAIAENLWDLLAGRSLKIAFGFVLLYAGYFMWQLQLHNGTLTIIQEFPYLLPYEDKMTFLKGFATVGVGWTICCLAGCWIFQGAIFPEWLCQTFRLVVKTGLLIVGVLSAKNIYANLGQNDVSLPFAVGFLVLGACETVSGVALGFELGVRASIYVPEEIQLFETKVGTWYWVRLGERTVLYILGVLLSFGLAWLLGLPGWELTTD